MGEMSRRDGFSEKRKLQRNDTMEYVMEWKMLVDSDSSSTIILTAVHHEREFPWAVIVTLCLTQVLIKAMLMLLK